MSHLPMVVLIALLNFIWLNHMERVLLLALLFYFFLTLHVYIIKEESDQSRENFHGSLPGRPRENSPTFVTILHKKQWSRFKWKEVFIPPTSSFFERHLPRISNDYTPHPLGFVRNLIINLAPSWSSFWREGNYQSATVLVWMPSYTFS